MGFWQSPEFMSGSETPESEDPDFKEDSPRPRRSSWRPVSRNLWKRKEEPHGLTGAVSRRLYRIAAVFSSTEFLLFAIAPLGGLGAYLTFYLAYDLGGRGLFGAYFIGIWAAIIVGVVSILEKSGYSKNFEGWDFPLRRVIFLPIGFLMVTGALLLFFFLTR